MDQVTAELLARRLHIAKEVIVREEYEMVFLQGLFASKLSDRLIFKGGTALRLAYQSQRFSEDLDFSLRGRVAQKDFGISIKAIAGSLPAVTITDLAEKYYTHFARLKIRETYLRQAFSIKIEVSKRPVKWQEGKDFTIRICKSEVMPLEAVGSVVSLERVLADKKKAVKSRQKARDLFDLWWLGQRLDKPVAMKLSEEKLKWARSELNQFLPEHMRLLVDSWREK